MNKLTVYTATGQAVAELEIGEEITAPFTYKLADIKKIDTKSGSFSKTIQLPGTKANNRFFGGIYDVNADFTSFNPNVKTFVRWVSQSEEILVGYMKLNKIHVDDLKRIFYDVTIFDTAVEFWNDIENKFVHELTNLDELSHVWNGNNIKQSWSTDWNQRGYFYPLLKNSVTFANAGGGVQLPRTTTERLFPAAFHKRLLDMVIRDNGYTWNGSLKTNPVYEREIIPYTGEHPNLTLSDASKRKFKVGFNADQVANNSWHGATVNAGYIRNYARTDWNFLGAIGFPDETGAAYGFNDLNNVWTSPVFTAPEMGQYAFNLNLLLRGQVQYYKNGNPAHSLDYKVNVMIYAQIDTGSQTFMSNGIALNPFAWYFSKELPDTSSTFVNATSQTQFTFAASAVLSQHTNGNYFVLQPGWKVRFFIGYSSQGLREATQAARPFYEGDLDANKRFQIASFSFKPLAGSFVECNDSLSAYGEGFLVPYRAFINKKLKQRDLFSDIIARYNAHIYVNPDNDRELIIDTGENFYNPPIESTLDWSHLKENDEQDVIVHASEIQNERLLFTYKQSGEEHSKHYNGATSEIYGQHEHEFANAFVKGVQKIETPFTETPIIEQGRLFFPAVEAGEKDGAFRVLYAPKGGIQLREWSSTRFFVLIAKDGTHTLGNNGSYYPYAGHLQNPNRVNDVTTYDVLNDNDLNFGTVAFLFPQSLVGVSSLPPFTMVNRYWLNRINQMHNGQMLTTLLNLNSRDIADIRRKPNSRIWINSAYWFVNKIEFEGNDNLRKLSKVELISLDNLTFGTGTLPRPTKPTVGSINSFVNSKVSTTNSVGFSVGNYSIKGFFNKVGDNASEVHIVGNENVVFPNVKNVNLQNSNNNVIKANNVTIIDSNDLTIESDNVTIIKNVLYFGDTQTPLFNLIDGGQDVLRTIGSSSKFNLVDSGKNVNLNLFSETPVVLIDSVSGETKKIKFNDVNNNRRED